MRCVLHTQENPQETVLFSHLHAHIANFPFPFLNEQSPRIIIKQNFFHVKNANLLKNNGMQYLNTIVLLLA